MQGNFTSDLSSVTPDAVILEKVELVNHTGQVKDISDLVTEVIIQESIYMPALLFEMTVLDSVNFFEDFQLIGQEKIIIEFQKKPLGDDEFQIFDFTFMLTEYPAFVKSMNSTVQTYIIRGTTPFAYMSKFKKISRQYREATSLEIIRIINTDLEHDGGYLSLGEESSEHRGIFNVQEPLKAAEFLRKNTYDENGAPFFLYQTFDKKVRFVSYSHLISDKNEVYETYRNMKGFNSDVGEKNDYIQRAKRILKLNSNLNLSKMFQATDGAFASRNFSLDYSNKTFNQNIYNYYSDTAQTRENTLGKKPSLSTQSGLGSQNDTLNLLPDSHVEYLSVNSDSYSGLKNYTGNLSKNIHRLNSYNTLFSTISHTIELAGDFYLNAGRKITLELPKSIDQEIYNKWKGGDVNNLTHTDEHLSGDYIIVSVIHTFTVGTAACSHNCSIEVNKDSLTIDI